jgi:hypothetical protein
MSRATELVAAFEFDRLDQLEQGILNGAARPCQPIDLRGLAPPAVYYGEQLAPIFR